MHTKDVGRFEASGFGMLSYIFEANFRISGKRCKKQLLFVFRDFDDENDNFEIITTKLNKELEEIWNKANKPDSLSSALLTDYF
jgi:hypothetical protein